MSLVEPTPKSDGEATCPVTKLGREVGCPIISEKFITPKPIGSNWAYADRLREQSSVYWNEDKENNTKGGYFVFTEMAAIKEMYKNTDLFSNESIIPWTPEPEFRFIPTMVDHPVHLEFRKLLNPWFSAKRVKATEDISRGICRRMVAETAPLGKTNFVKEIALRFPTEMFLTFIGMDFEDTPKLLAWVEDFFDGWGGDPEAQERMGLALEQIDAYWMEAVEERRQESGPREDDLCSHLVHATRLNGNKLTDKELKDTLTLLVLGGLDTTRGELGYLFWHLAMHPEDRRRLREDPSLIPSAVEETLRIHTIAFGNARKVKHDTEFHGVQLEKGDMVYGLNAAANRDPNEFERSNEFVLDRKINPHVGFALGPHRCLGIHLARNEMKVCAEEWFKAIPDFWLDTDEQLTERGAGSMLSALSLPLAWEATA